MSPRTKTAPNGLTNGHEAKSPLDLHDCNAQPIYPSRVTSNGAAGEEDYPLTDQETARHHNAPVFQGGVPLSKATLASEGENLRHQVPEKYRRISRPVPMMRHEYDVVVIGSGYGGAVAASRIARAGKTVCVLELGKERWPGEFPSDLASATPEIHITGNIANTDISHFDGGDRQGLYHLVLGEGQNVFVGNGLGGTSLLNGNVFLPADHRTLALDEFPAEIREDPACLDKYYERAAQVLQPETYPEDFPRLKKLERLEEQAKLMGPEYSKRFRKVPQTTTFKSGVNNMGVRQQASTLSGQDATGVNDWSKNSVLMNYLPDAWNHGAEIFCGCEVRYVKPCTEGPNKWSVFFAWHGDKRDAFKTSIYTELMWVQAREFVFLGAGSLGTTEILLRSREYGLPLSRHVGLNMSGNGDILAFGYNGEKTANAIGTDDPEYLAKHPVGPTINGIIDMRDEEVAPHPRDGFVIEEGAVPKALAHLLHVMYAATSGKRMPTGLALRERLDELAGTLTGDLFGPWGHHSSLNRTMIYLIMSHDDNQGSMCLESNKPSLQFSGVEHSLRVQQIDKLLQDAMGKIGAEYIPNPFTSKKFGRSEISVHPLGGANMSPDGTGIMGATNHLGQVFKGSGKEVYEGLVVVDAASIPSALGVNPFATITALAERSVETLARQKGWKIDYTLTKDEIDFKTPKVSWPLTKEMLDAHQAIADSPKTGGARFTEKMEGYIYIGDDITDYQMAYEAAQGAASAAKFYLSVDAWDINTLIYKKSHAAMLTGTFSCGALSRDPLMILQGEFKLFSRDKDVPETKSLVYRFDMQSTSGEMFSFEGHKIVDDTIAGSMTKTWSATTTLYVKIKRLDKTLVGNGILNLSLKNFGTELLTLDMLGETELDRLCAGRKFLSYFGHNVAEKFVPFSKDLHLPCHNSMMYSKHVSQDTWIKTADGQSVKVQKWMPYNGVGDTPILLIPGSSTDYQIYALPTIAHSFLDHLLEKGYVVYCVEFRIGNNPAAQKGWTTYDARFDIAAAVKFVCQDMDMEQIYVVSHCAGSQALAMGLLDGTITGVGGLTASQVFMHPVFAKVNQFKAKIGLALPWAYEDVVGPWFPMVSMENPTAFEQLLRCYPVGGMQDYCRSIVCRRSEVVFGRLWSHHNLNDATHQNLASFVGGVATKNLEQLEFMGVHGYVVDNQGNTLLTPENIERLRGIPIHFIHGELNTVYNPVSTMNDMDLLMYTFGNPENMYSRTPFPSKGHLDCWMGHSSYRDVYVDVEEHARKIVTERGLSRPSSSSDEEA